MANIYVRKSGNDSNDGSTPALAKLTIAGAISAMTSGDTIYVGSGVYRESITAPIKTIIIIGDTTGEYTGDAGEVIWSGMNADDTDFTGNGAISQDVRSNTSYDLILRNFKFQNFRCDKVFEHLGLGKYELENCFFSNIIGIPIYGLHTYTSGRSGFKLKNIYINGCYCQNGIAIVAFSKQEYGHIENIKIENMFNNTDDRSAGIYISMGGRGINYGKNIYVSNIFSTSINYECCGIWVECGNLENCYAGNIYNKNNAYGMLSIFYSGSVTNSSVGGLYSESGTTTKYKDVGTSNCIEKCGYNIPKISSISKYSPLRGQGSTTFPATDIEGNPRPAYGNGTKCDIGASEATSDTIQKESTIKDSGDYSIKVSPCNYFKKTFQVPVTASTLRTVKVKIRIDGTWGTYLPRVSLSGQGMTLSQTTKNSTTGSFEELTVSGTPTTTGIALLTIEAHSANTDAAFYIDTITIE